MMRVLSPERPLDISSVAPERITITVSVTPVKTEENARALSAALKEVLPWELERYQSKGRTEIEKKVHESSCCVKQKIAAGFLGLKDTRSIRYLADRTPPLLKRCSLHGGGKITASSLISYKQQKNRRH